MDSSAKDRHLVGNPLDKCILPAVEKSTAWDKLGIFQLPCLNREWRIRVAELAISSKLTMSGGASEQR